MLFFVFLFICKNFTVFTNHIRYSAEVFLKKQGLALLHTFVSMRLVRHNKKSCRGSFRWANSPLSSIHSHWQMRMHPPRSCVQAAHRRRCILRGCTDTIAMTKFDVQVGAGAPAPARMSKLDKWFCPCSYCVCSHCMCTHFHGLPARSSRGGCTCICQPQRMGLINCLNDS